MKKTEDIQIGQRIKHIRSNLKQDQKTFATNIGATVSALSNWENGRNKPNDIMLNQIAKLGDITVDELLYGNLDQKILYIITKKKYFFTKERLEKFKKEIIALYGDIPIRMDDLESLLLAEAIFSSDFSKAEFEDPLNNEIWDMDQVIQFNIATLRELRDKNKAYINEITEHRMNKINSALDDAIKIIENISN